MVVGCSIIQELQLFRPAAFAQIMGPNGMNSTWQLSNPSYLAFIFVEWEEVGTHRPALFVMSFVELREVVFHCSLFLRVKTEQGNVELFTKQTSKSMTGFCIDGNI